MTIIRVYSKPDCTQCEMTKKYLTDLGLAYELEDILEEGNFAAVTALGYKQAPVVVVGDESWAGFQPARIKLIADRLAEEPKPGGPRFPHIHVSLSGDDGNAFFMVSKARRALREDGVAQDEIEKFSEEALAGDYAAVIATIGRWVVID